MTKPITTNLRVINHTTGESEHSSEPYGDWYEETNNDIQGLEIVKGKNRYNDVVADFEVKDGDELFLVYAEYSSGDSFGHSTGNLEFIAVYKTEQKAWDAYNVIDNGGSTDLVFILESGLEYKLGYAPWDGYFENLQHFNVVKLKVDNE